MKEKNIYSRRIAVELRKLGFKILRVDVNWKKPNFDVWVFEDTEALQRALAYITNRNYEDRTKGEQKNEGEVSRKFSCGR